MVKSGKNEKRFFFAKNVFFKQYVLDQQMVFKFLILSKQYD